MSNASKSYKDLNLQNAAAVKYHYYHIDSRGRTSGTTSNFVVPHPKIQNLFHFKLDGYSLTNSWYNVTEDNCTFTVRSGGVDYASSANVVAKIPVGSYSSLEFLMKTIQNQVNLFSKALSPSWEVEIGRNPYTNFVEITRGTTNYIGITGEGWKMLGFQIQPGIALFTSSTTGTLTAVDAPDILGGHYIYVCSNQLTAYETNISSTTNHFSNLLFKIPIQGSFGSIILGGPQGDFSYNSPAYRPIDISLYNEKGEVLDLHGGHFELTITFISHNEVTF